MENQIPGSVSIYLTEKAAGRRERKLKFWHMQPALGSLEAHDASPYTLLFGP